MRRSAAGLAAAVLSAACGLTDLEGDRPETVVVVQGVVRADQPQQFVILERTFNGSLNASADGFPSGFVPGGGVAVPLEGAQVTISNLSLPADPCGRNVALTESAGPADRLQPGAYWSPDGCPTLRPSDTLELRVVAGDDRVMGRTVMPGVNRMTVEIGGVPADVPGPVLVFNRDVDTMRVAVDPIAGRAIMLGIRDRLSVESPQDVAQGSHQFFSDSTALTLAGDHLDVFADLEDPPDLFDAGRFVRVTVGYADRNFYDQLRSFNLPITGRGFINHIEGGFGHFSSMVAADIDVRVVAEIDDPREGRYRLAGSLEGVPVSLEWDVYFNRRSLSRGLFGTGEEQNFSSFLEGQWVTGPMDSWTTGFFLAGVVETTIRVVTGVVTEGRPEVLYWHLIGDFNVGSSSSLDVQVDGQVIGRLTLSKL